MRRRLPKPSCAGHYAVSGRVATSREACRDGWSVDGTSQQKKKFGRQRPGGSSHWDEETAPVTRGEIGVLLRVIGEALVVEKGTLSPPEIRGSPPQVWEDL